MMKFNSWRLALAGVTLAALTACGGSSSHGGGGGGGGGGDVATFSDKTLTGKITGTEWTFVSGVARPSFEDASKISIQLWNEQVDDPCNGFSFGSQKQVIGSLPKSAGVVTMSPTKNVTLYDQNGNKNIVLTNGAYELTEIAADHITGRLVGSFDGDNALNGTFTIPLCAAE